MTDFRIAHHSRRQTHPSPRSFKQSVRIFLVELIVVRLGRQRDRVTFSGWRIAPAVNYDQRERTSFASQIFILKKLPRSFASAEPRGFSHHRANSPDFLPYWDRAVPSTVPDGAARENHSADKARARLLLPATSDESPATGDAR